jgi:hypothetical protein
MYNLYNAQQMVKRAWSDLSQQGWGKRSWTQLHGVWGKRRWDQLHGAWGKRTPDQLEDDSKAEQQSENSQEDEDQQQSSSEVEREEANDSDDTVENSKRSGWNKMQGVWGKRSSSSSNSGPAIEGMGNNDLLLLISGTGDQLYQQREDDQAKVNVEVMRIIHSLCFVVEGNPPFEGLKKNRNNKEARASDCQSAKVKCQLSL